MPELLEVVKEVISQQVYLGVKANTPEDIGKTIGFNSLTPNEVITPLTK